MKITLLARRGRSSFVLINYLVDAGFRDIDVVFETPPSRLAKLRGKARAQGGLRTAGQLLFVACAVPVLERMARGRIAEVLSEHKLRTDPPDSGLCRCVGNVNAIEVVEHLRHRRPDAVLVSGTRILLTSILEATAVPFLNIHAGITPEYRGVHGGYWALWNRDPDRFGATVHVVDAGVDTGAVLHQAYPKPTRRDNFASYPVLQQASALPGLLRILRELAEGREPIALPVPAERSRQWYHPSLWQYLAGCLRGVT